MISILRLIPLFALFNQMSQAADLPFTIVSDQCHRESLLIHPADLAKLGEIGEGDQVRLFGLPGKNFAAFTLEPDSRVDPGTVGLSQDGLDRITKRKIEKLRIAPFSLPENLTESGARREGEMIEFIFPDDFQGQKRLLILTPHGGAIETNTDDIALDLMSRDPFPGLAVLWGCQGYSKGNENGAYERWHITSTRTSTNTFPKLGQIVTKQSSFEHALSIHGYRGNSVLVGGAAPLDLKQRMKSELHKAMPAVLVQVAKRGDPFSGMAAQNIVNRYSKKGIQLELPKKVRDEHREDLVRGITAFYSTVFE